MEDKVITDEIQVLQDIDLKGVTQVQISDELSNNPEFMLQAMDIDRYAIELASDDLKNDSQFMQESLKIDLDLFKFVGDDLKNDTDFLKSAISNNDLVIPLINDDLKNDKEFMTELVDDGTMVIPYASDDLKNDLEFALKSVEQNPNAFNFVSDELKAENGNTLEDFLSGANDNSIDKEEPDIRIVEGTSYTIIDSEIVGDFEIALGENTNEHYATWVRNVEVDIDKGGENFNHGNYFMEDKESAIENFQERVTEYKEIALDVDLSNDTITKEQTLEMVEENGLELKNLPDFQDDEDVVLKAVEQDGWALEFASDELRNDEIFVFEVMKIDSSALGFAGDELRNDPDFIKQAIDIDDYAYFNASDELRADPEIILYAVEQGYPIDEINEDWIFNDESFMKDIIALDSDNVNFIGEELQNDKDFIIEVLEEYGNGVLEYIDPDLFNDKDFMEQVISLSPDESTFDLASEDLKNNPEFVISSMFEGVDVNDYLSDEIKNDPAFITLVVDNFQENSLNLNELIGDDLKANPEFMQQINDIVAEFKENVVQDSPFEDLNAENHLETVEISTEDNLNMIDGILNNTTVEFKEDDFDFGITELMENKEDLTIFEQTASDLKLFFNAIDSVNDLEQISNVVNIEELQSLNTLENLTNMLENGETEPINQVLQEINQIEYFQEVANDLLIDVDYLKNIHLIAIDEKIENINTIFENIDVNNLDITSDEFKQLLDDIKEVNYPIFILDENIRGNEELILILSKECDFDNIQYATVELLKNPDFIENAIDMLGIDILEYADESLKNNDEFMKKMVEIDSSAVSYLGDELKTNYDFLYDSLNINNETIQYIDDTVLHDNVFLQELENNHPQAYDILHNQSIEIWDINETINQYSQTIDNTLEEKEPIQVINELEEPIQVKDKNKDKDKDIKDGEKTMEKTGLINKISKARDKVQDKSVDDDSQDKVKEKSKNKDHER